MRGWGGDGISLCDTVCTACHRSGSVIQKSLPQKSLTRWLRVIPSRVLLVRFTQCNHAKYKKRNKANEDQDEIKFEVFSDFILN